MKKTLKEKKTLVGGRVVRPVKCNIVRGGKCAVSPAACKCMEMSGGRRDCFLAQGGEGPQWLDSMGQALKNYLDDLRSGAAYAPTPLCAYASSSDQYVLDGSFNLASLFFSNISTSSLAMPGCPWKLQACHKQQSMCESSMGGHFPAKQYCTDGRRYTQVLENGFLVKIYI